MRKNISKLIEIIIVSGTLYTAYIFLGIELVQCFSFAVLISYVLSKD